MDVTHSWIGRTSLQLSHSGVYNIMSQCSQLRCSRAQCLQVTIHAHFARRIQQIRKFAECSVESQWTRERRRKGSTTSSQDITILGVCMKREYCIKGHTQELGCFFHILLRIIYVHSNVVPSFIPATSTHSATVQLIKLSLLWPHSTHSSSLVLEVYSQELWKVDRCYAIQSQKMVFGIYSP